MDYEDIPDAEKLRTHFNACQPDDRTNYISVRDLLTGMPRSITLEDQHKHISEYVLNQSVPKDIQVHFETGKNCYLYAWFVFRFYQVAESHICATLELALRTRFSDFVMRIEESSKFGNPPGLESLLKHAMLQNVLKSDLFPSRIFWANEMARHRFRGEIYNQMIQSGATEHTYDDSHIEANEDDLNFDWASHYTKYLPMIRNNLAHGSSDLHHSVLRTFDVVTSIINMLYPLNEAPF